MCWMMRLILCAFLGAAATGCAAGGAIAAKLAPPPATPAEYTPDKNQKLLVIVENYTNPDAVAAAAERLARDITDQLKQQKVAPVIDPTELLELRQSKGPEFAKMDIPSVASALGAAQVIYVDLSQFTIEPPAGSELMKGKAAARVKVVDVASGRTLWPRESSEGREVRYETKYTRAGNGASPDSVQEELYQKLSGQISRLFYKWTSDQVDGTEPPLTDPDALPVGPT